MDMKTPRVNSALLPNYINRTVRMTAKVIKLEGDTAIVQASDNGQVTIKLNRDSNFSDSYVEVIGRVTGDTTLSELTSHNMGENIDMKMVDAVVTYSHKYDYIFHGEGSDYNEY